MGFLNYLSSAGPQFAFILVASTVIVMAIVSIPDSWNLTKRRVRDEQMRKAHKWWATTEFLDFIFPYILLAAAFIAIAPLFF